MTICCCCRSAWAGGLYNCYNDQMNFLDLLIIVVVLSQAVRWAQYGFSRGFFSLAAFWLGIIIGAAVAPFFISFFNDPLVKLFFALLIIFGAGSIVGSVGRAIGDKIFHLINKARLNWIDGIAGALFSTVFILVVSWFAAAMLAGTPFQNINRQINGSRIIHALNDVLPPAPTVLARIGGLINPNSFPQVFLGPEPQQIEPVDPPSSADIAAALAIAGKSTVRIESVGCGGQLTGSGFIAADRLVVTNAHVVAGVSNPTVVDVNGRYRAQPVYFDPDLDLAVLRVDGDLAGESLAIADSDLPRGTVGVTLGYPSGGPLKAVPAGLVRSVEATGLNIYNDRNTLRPIYILQTEVISGNSGGPVVLPDGTVIGVIFARSEANTGTGYAIRSPEVLQALKTLSQRSRPVDTQRCVST